MTVVQSLIVAQYGPDDMPRAKANRQILSPGTYPVLLLPALATSGR